MRRVFILLLFMVMTACAPRPPEVIIITATFPPLPGAPLTEPTLTAVAQVFGTVETAVPPPTSALPSPPPATSTRSGPTPLPGLVDATLPPVSTGDVANIVQTYTVQAGDTLTGIATANNITVANLIALNTLTDPNNLFVGQVLTLPPLPGRLGSDIALLPDRRLVRAAEAAVFDVTTYINGQTGYLQTAGLLVDGRLLTGAQIVERVALEFSIDPRLLLAALEYRSGWVTNPQPSDAARQSPLGAPPFRAGGERDGLYLQMTWLADQLNAGYYGWNTRGLATLEFTDSERVRIADTLNAGTVGVQYWLSRTSTLAQWMVAVDEGSGSFIETYMRLFGDAYADGDAPIVPEGLTQPELALPFAPGAIWYYTGGPHGGYGSGSAWAAIDFAPPDDITNVPGACYVSDFFATAVASGVIARTAEGTVILDLDGDGNEATGWSILYLHIDERDRVAAGTRVATGDRIGRPSCDGGFSNATHMHIGRRYNGEWLPADCGTQCRIAVPPFMMGGWRVTGLPGQEYQGGLTRPGERRIAEQGRSVIENRISW